MIIWIRNRRGWVGAVFFVLAAIFAARSSSAASAPAATPRSRTSSAATAAAGTTTAQPSSIGDLEKKVKTQPKNAQAWQQLADAYSSASRPSDEARAMGRVVALKPGNIESLQRLAAAQAQVATTETNQAQQLQQRAYTSSPANDSTFSGGTLGTLSEDPVTLAQAAAESEQQTTLLKQASKYSTRANTWWKRTSSTYAKVVALPSFAKNDLAASIWLNYASAAQSSARHEDRHQGLRGVPQARARGRQRPAGEVDRQGAQEGRGSELGLHDCDADAVIDIETTPDGAALISVSEPLDYGLVADLAEVLASDSVREAHHVVVELAAPGSMDESAVGVLVRSARDTRLRGGRLTLCGADARTRDALQRIGVARLVHLADDASTALSSGRAA